jgi:bifunctional non-homologous end joining protein LigD
MIKFGVSTLPAADTSDADFLDDLVERGHTALELAFTRGFPWDEARCESFGAAAAARNVSLSVHAPYFAVLTIDDPERYKRTRAAVEHTMKLGRRLGAGMVVVHPGVDRRRSPEELMATAVEALESIESKVTSLGVSLGLETTGAANSFGNIGDIALLAAEFEWVRPVVDWAHVHATTGGRLTETAAFASVLAFVVANFPEWKLEPLHCHYSHNLWGAAGEIRHVPYGEGDIPIGPLIEAVAASGLEVTLISEARDTASHSAIWNDVRRVSESVIRARPQPDRVIASGRIQFPSNIDLVVEGDAFDAPSVPQSLRLRNLDKPFFPDGYSKGDLIQYYADIAPYLLPHLAQRAIVMARFPDGADGGFFYEKQAPAHVPDWMPLMPILSKERAGAIDFTTAPNRAALMWFANMGCIEIHPWLSRRQTLEFEDFAVFDLDPAEGAAWEQVADTARHTKVALDRLGLRSYVKTSGATGLHVYVPLAPVHEYARVRKFVETVGRLLAAADPENITMEWDIPKRAGKVFVDHNQNVAGKTIASVYSVRPRRGAPVSTPIHWEELDEIDPADFTIATIWGRLRRHGDIFAPVLSGGQTLDAAEEALGLS